MSTAVVQRDMSLTYDLKKAWIRNEFDILLQPQIEADSRRIAGFEALLRWRHPRKGIILPEDFLPVAEELDLTRRLDYLVFDKVCAFLHKRLEDHKELFCVSSNFARAHFFEKDFVLRLEKIRNKYQIPARYLAIEMLEGSSFADVDLVQEVVMELKARGYSVYLDDCGGADFNVGDLMLQNVTHIKIDKHVVDKINQENVQVLLRGLCAMIHRMSYKVICEGIETLEQLNLAKKLGVDMIQGYYFYKPMNLLRAEVLYDVMSANEST